MKVKSRLWILGIIPLLASCASQPMTLAPVGPSPFGRWAASPDKGDLQVYTQTEEYYEDDLSYFPHTDYELCTPDGKHLKHVWNHQNHEDETPATVALAPGHYQVKAWADNYGQVVVPVVVEAGRLTRVILQPGWKPGTAVASTDLVQFPGGYPVGWRAQLPGTTP